MAGSEHSRIPELDGLRGIAIGLVLLFHYFFLILGPTPGSFLAYALAVGRLTWTGVDLFFVLSGFLIGGILLDARGSSNYFQVFYTRRFYRILPLYAVWFCGVQLMVLAVRTGHVHMPEFLDERLPAYPYAVFLQNFWMAARSTFGGFTSGGTWSLAIEEQFYLTIPIVIWFVDVGKKPLIILAGIVAAPVFRVLCFALFPEHRLMPFFLMPCRADALLCGVLGAILWRDTNWRTRVQMNPRPLKLAIIVLLAGAGFFTIHSSPLDGWWMISIGYTWMAMLYLCVLLFALTQPGSKLSSYLRSKWLMGLGTIAYGVYLAHQYVRAAVIPWFAVSNKLVTTCVISIIALPLTVLLCRVSYVYFEKPLIRVGHKSKYQAAVKTQSNNSKVCV